MHCSYARSRLYCNARSESGEKMVGFISIGKAPNVQWHEQINGGKRLPYDTAGGVYEANREDCRSEVWARQSTRWAKYNTALSGRDSVITKSVTPWRARATSRRAETISGGCPLLYWWVSVSEHDIGVYKGAKVATGEDWESVVQENKYRRSHRAPNEAVWIGYSFFTTWYLINAYLMHISILIAEWAGAQGCCADTVCARGDEKILPERSGGWRFF